MRGVEGKQEKRLENGGEKKTQPIFWTKIEVCKGRAGESTGMICAK